MVGFNVELGPVYPGAPGNREVEATVTLAGVDLLSMAVPFSSGPGACQEAESEALRQLALRLQQVLEV